MKIQLHHLGMNPTPQWLERTELLFGSEKLAKLSEKHVLIVGLGGVGSFAAEFVARAGVGKFTIVDGDTVDITNINRQLQATHETIGHSKSALIEKRLKEINPCLNVTAYDSFLRPEPMDELIANNDFDLALDCIDSITPKIHLITSCYKRNIPVISSMGAGGKSDPSSVKVVDLSETHHCKMGYYVRKRLRKEYSITTGVWAVFSSELQKKESLKTTNGANFKKSFYGTCSWMPALFGLHAAAKAIELLSE
ncbi:MAG: tRNA threonylcarbamoyladenosine dehydratase [Cytophagales bacterium]